MRILALDTTTRAGSIAVVEDARVTAEHSGDPARSHAERLPADILQVLQSVSLTAADIDVFAVASGPGSFTGLRIGIATVQGLAFVNGRPIVAVSALEALAQAGAEQLPGNTLVGAWMDAHRRDVFSALYRVTHDVPYRPERLIELDGPTVGSPAVTLASWRFRDSAPLIVIGDGAVAFADTIGEAARILPPPVLAPAIGRMALVHAERGEALNPAAVHPLYVRRPDAVLAQEARNSR